MGILEQAELFKTMNRPNLARPWRSLTNSHEILTQSWFNSSICEIIIWHLYLLLFEALRFLAIFISFFYRVTFGWKGNFKFWWFHRKYLMQIYLNQPYLKCLQIICIHKINFYVKKVTFFCIFLIVPKLSNFWWLYQHQNLS